MKSIFTTIYDKIFSTRAAGLYILLFAIAIGVATFVENDFGTSSAQHTIFRARLFELLLVLFGGTIIANIFRFRFIQQKKWASLNFHSAIIIIIIGAGITRYFGSLRPDGVSRGGDLAGGGARGDRDPRPLRLGTWCVLVSAPAPGEPAHPRSVAQAGVRHAHQARLPGLRTGPCAVAVQRRGRLGGHRLLAIDPR